MNLSLTLRDLNSGDSKGSKKETLKLKKVEEAEVRAKLAKIESYLPTHALKSAKMEAVLARSNVKATDHGFEIEIKLNLPEKILVANARSKTVLGAVDGAEKKMARLIRKYKTQHYINKKMDRKSLAKLKKLLGREG